jgi:hypothetical protein
MCHGEWAGRVTFPEEPPFPLRKGQHYNNRAVLLATLGYDGIPAFASLTITGFDAIRDHGLDVMHNCFLGIAKTLFFEWFKPYKVRITQNKETIS